MKTCEVLVKLRKKKKITQQQVADYLKISKSAYSRYENSLRRPSVETLEKIANFYSISPLVFFNKDNSSEMQLATRTDLFFSSIDEFFEQLLDNVISSYEHVFGKDEIHTDEIICRLIIAYQKLEFSDFPNASFNDVVETLKKKAISINSKK